MGISNCKCKPFSFKQCFNIFFHKNNEYNLNANYKNNNKELVDKICSKTNLTRADIETWHSNFLVWIKFLQ